QQPTRSACWTESSAQALHHCTNDISVNGAFQADQRTTRKLNVDRHSRRRAYSLFRPCLCRRLIGHRDRQQSHLLFNAALVSQLPSPEKLPPVKDLIRIYAMLPSYRRYRQTRRQCLLYDPPLFLGGPMPPPTRSALTKLHTCIHPSPSAATCYRRSSLIA